jgi:hypothetical protein
MPALSYEVSLFRGERSGRDVVVRWCGTEVLRFRGGIGPRSPVALRLSTTLAPPLPVRKTDLGVASLRVATDQISMTPGPDPPDKAGDTALAQYLCGYNSRTRAQPSGNASWTEQLRMDPRSRSWTWLRSSLAADTLLKRLATPQLEGSELHRTSEAAGHSPADWPRGTTFARLSRTRIIAGASFRPATVSDTVLRARSSARSPSRHGARRSRL